jgi:hypothetical protein
MAPKKKEEMPPLSESTRDKLRAALEKDARNAAKAAGSLLRKPISASDKKFSDEYGNTWEQTVKDVDMIDKAFGEEEVLQKENFVDYLRGKLRSGMEARVMQIGPNGELVDVTDRVKATLRPEDIGGIQTSDGKIARVRNPQSREEAYELLRQAIPDLLDTRLGAQDGKSDSIRRMESILEESNKILQHWKK